MRVYHFLSAEHGLSNVRLRRLKIARLADLNDPFEGLAIALPDRARRAAWIEYIKQLNTEFGLLCFSKNWSNPVQWTHYADRHRGICLGFDVPDELTVKVTYRPKPYDPRIVDSLLALREPIAEDLLLKVMSTKFSHWQYEQEVRVHAAVNDPDPNGLHFTAFSPRLRLAEVIVGHRATVTRAQIAEALGDLGGSVTTTKARLAFQSYSVVKQQNQRLWE